MALSQYAICPYPDQQACSPSTTPTGNPHTVQSLALTKPSLEPRGSRVPARTPVHEPALPPLTTEKFLRLSLHAFCMSIPPHCGSSLGTYRLSSLNVTHTLENPVV